MNEGHASLLTVALLDEHAQLARRKAFNREDVEAVRGQCVFTTHTPVAAGHDRLPVEMAMRVLGRNELIAMKDVFCFDNAWNMTYLALNLSHYVNGVAKRHGEVSSHVRRLRNRRDHKRRPCANLDSASVSGVIRPLHP